MTTDDLLKERPDLAPWRPAVGIAPQLTDAELVTLAMMQAMLGFTSEARWLRHARAHLRHLFPYLPQQLGYNKRLRKSSELLRRVTRFLATSTSVWSDDVWIVDSTPVECGRSRETRSIGAGRVVVRTRLPCGRCDAGCLGRITIAAGGCSRSPCRRGVCGVCAADVLGGSGSVVCPSPAGSVPGCRAYWRPRYRWTGAGRSAP